MQDMAQEHVDKANRAVARPKHSEHLIAAVSQVRESIKDNKARLDRQGW